MILLKSSKLSPTMYGMKDTWGGRGGGGLTTYDGWGEVDVNGLDEEDWGGKDLSKDEPCKVDPIKDTPDSVWVVIPLLSGGVRNGGTPPKMGGRS